MKKLYDSDLSDKEYKCLSGLIPESKPGGRPRTVDMRAVVNAIFYLLKTGCQWRMLPGEYPPWNTVYYYFRAWKRQGVWHQMRKVLYHRTREQSGRNEHPSLGIMDSQSVKTTQKGAPEVTMPTRR